VKEAGSRFHVIKADLGTIEPVKGVVTEAIQTFGGLDILVNNAGIIRRADALDFTEEDWDAVIDVNLKTAFFLSQAAGRHMIDKGRGKIINIASLLSFQGGITVPGYAAAKGGVMQLTKALANEWAAHGINVNAIAPGYMETDNTAALRADATRHRQITERIPAGRWGTPEDLAGAAIFLASPASDYVNGHVLVVDGGWMGR
jgi:2-deoxy-D-gluconate 3-dehydrogenase